jgi:DNA-binding response OmpR family regulator
LDNQFSILLVDDDKKIISLYKEFLLKNNNRYTIKVAFNGQEAIKTILLEKIDLVLLDISMPILSGLEVLAELHNRRIWLPVILISGSAVDTANDKIVTDFGIIDIYCKPLNLQTVVNKIAVIFQNKENSDSISGISLPNILQSLAMEERTGVLQISKKSITCRIFFKKGKMIDIEAVNLSANEALVEFVGDPSNEKKIKIEYYEHNRNVKFNRSLTEILIEASRLYDEFLKKRSEEDNMTKKNVKEEKKKPEKIFKKTIKTLSESVGEALIAAEIWKLQEAEMIEGINSQSEVCDLFSQITAYLNWALNASEFPFLGDYYLLNLEKGKTKLIILEGDYLLGILIDSKKMPMGFLLKMVLPDLISSFKKTVNE